MIERLTLYNFQQHAFLDLELDRVTVLVGPTGKGKTSVLRGLGFVAVNSPSKLSLIRRGKEWMKAVLDVDGHQIKRTRGKGKNLYVLDGKKLKAFGTKVPEEVAKILNLRDVNFQYQHDKPYWFFDRKGEVGRQLNQIVNLEAIDQSLSKAATEVRKAKSVVQVSKQRLKSAKKAKKELEWVPEMLEELGRLERLEEKWKSKKEKVDSLRSSLVDARTYQRRKEELLSAKEAAAELMRLARQSLNAGHAADTLRQVAKDLKKLNIRKIDFSEMERIRAKADAAAERRREVEILVDQLRKAEGDSCQLRREAKRKEKELHKRLKGRCPVCMCPLPKDFGLVSTEKKKTNAGNG